MSEHTHILRVLTGSQAHGLATPDSDYDYRGVFVAPTQELLHIGAKPKSTNWIEGNEDDTSWEIGHFLGLATKCNPTILEVFLSPVTESTADGEKLRALFPWVWNSVAVRDAFVGYGLNQRKKFLDEKDGRPAKFACAYLRTLYQADELLRTGTFTVRMADTPVGGLLRKWKGGDYTVGEVMQVCSDWERLVKQSFEANPDKKTDLERINAFLLDIRYLHWK